MAFSFVTNSVNDQTSSETLNIMTYELAMMFILINLKNKDIGTSLFLKTELADFVSMCRMFCEQTELIFKELNLNRLTDLSAGSIFIALGKLTQKYHYKKRFGSNSTKGEPQEALDILCDYIYSFCLAYNWSYFDIMELGEKRYLERMNDLIKNGINSKLKKEFQRE